MLPDDFFLLLLLWLLLGIDDGYPRVGGGWGNVKGSLKQGSKGRRG